MRPRSAECAAAVSGALFGTGLIVGGMTRPAKVIGFLDVFGAWDASLLLVMAGAVAVHTLAYRIVRGRTSSLLGAAFAIPKGSIIDAKLLLGAALFGIGWGMSGYCPGPSVVALATARPGILAFVAALLLGSFLTARIERWFVRVRPGEVRPKPGSSAAEPS